MNLFNYVFALLISSIAINVYAEENETLLDRLFVAHGLSQEAKNDIEMCKQNDGFPSVEDTYKQNPNAFNGVAPDSPFWEDVRAAVDELHHSHCDLMSSDELISIFKTVMTSMVTQEDLLKAIEFAESDVGRKFFLARLAVTKEYNQRIYRLAPLNTEIARKRYFRHIELISKKDRELREKGNAQE